MSILTATGLSKYFGAQDIFHDVSLQVAHGELTALVGPNGVGKTTLLRLILGELQPDKGKINRPREYHIGYLPQEEIEIQGDSVLDTALAGHDKIAELIVGAVNGGGIR